MMRNNKQTKPIRDEQTVVQGKPGRELEDIVAAIEQAMVPGGFKVDIRKPIFNESGGQIAEFDIEISGKLGTIPVQLLIECRDRPSQGKQPASWIEQLVGRRDRFNFASVIAVSTTGFADPAIDYAKSAGIILRNVTRISEVSHDFELFGGGHEGGVEISYLRIAEGTAPRLFKAKPEQGFPGDDLGKLKRLMIRTDGREDFKEFPSCLLDHLQAENPRWFSVPKADVEEFFPVKLGPVEVRLDDGRVTSIDHITVNLVFRRIHFRGKTIRTWSYSDFNKRIGYYALYATQTPVGDFLHSVYFALNEDGTEKAPIVLRTTVVKLRDEK
jgi:hypothetical protein